MKQFLFTKFLFATALCFGQCYDYENDSEDSHIRSAIDSIYSCFLNHEILQHSIAREDIWLSDIYGSTSIFCPENEKIVIMPEHIRKNMIAIGDLAEDDLNTWDISINRLSVGIHPVLSHEYSHFIQKKIDLFQLNMNDSSRQHKEYQADFMAGYLNGRSTWLCKRLLAQSLCAKTIDEYAGMVDHVMNNNKDGMRQSLKCLLKVFNEYQIINVLNHQTDCRHGLESERKRAYVNGFISALNYGIKTWNPNDDKALSGIIQLLYGPVESCKEKFANNLFTFLGTELKIPVDNSVWKYVITTNDLVVQSNTYVKTLQICR